MARTNAPRRTAGQIAQETYDGAKKRLEGKTARLARLKDDLTRLEGEIKDLTAEVEYLSKHPALPANVSQSKADLI